MVGVAFLRAVITQFRNAFLYSCSGFRLAYAEEMAFRIECIVLLLLLPVALLVPVTWLEKALLVSSLLLMLLVELLNSAIERVVDLCSPNTHPLAKAAKDMGSAGVFCSAVIALLVWVAVLFG